MAPTTNRIVSTTFENLNDVYDAMVDAWVQKDVEQFAVAFEDEGWVLSYPTDPQTAVTINITPESA